MGLKDTDERGHDTRPECHPEHDERDLCAEADRATGGGTDVSHGWDQTASGR